MTEEVVQKNQPDKKDKKKVVGESFTDEQLKQFLDYEPKDTQVSRDYQLLIKAYRGLSTEAFERFIGFYKAQGYDLNPKDEHGQAFQEMIARNVSHPEYLEIVRRANAK